MSVPTAPAKGGAEKYSQSGGMGVLSVACCGSVNNINLTVSEVLTKDIQSRIHPIQLRKAGRVVQNMQASGYSSTY